MKNLNLLFNKTYYSGMADTETFNEAVGKRNDELFDTVFNDSDYIACRVPDCRSFLLKTRYPGLLVGTGYAHGLGYDNVSADINCGFSFDYVSGQPYIPGSSVKGILRSAFQQDELKECIAGCCGINKNQVKILENQIFGTSAEDDGEGDDVFLDAVIRCGNSKGHILGDDYITPHCKSLVKNPTPIRIIKILPDVVFEFRFVLKDFEKDGIVVTVDQKLQLFSELAQILGIGAKTNVGYGAMTPCAENNVQKYLNSNSAQPVQPTQPVQTTVEQIRENDKSCNNKSNVVQKVSTTSPRVVESGLQKNTVYTATVTRSTDKGVFVTVNDAGKNYEGMITKNRLGNKSYKDFKPDPKGKKKVKVQVKLIEKNKYNQYDFELVKAL